jgi:ubiquinone/menaquinone biosynthesis C-methylase UbiE
MLISIGDFIDFYYQLMLKRGRFNPFSTLFRSGIKRTQTWWNMQNARNTSFWNIPAIMYSWNKKITGESQTLYMHYVREKWFGGIAKINLLSIGCGEGRKEMEIARLCPEWNITGFDLSEKRIGNARSESLKRGINNVDFYVADVFNHQFEEAIFDIVLFDSSLHHFSNFSLLFDRLSRCLKEHGFVVINEYVGVDRFQWTREQLVAANGMLRTIPSDLRCRFGTGTVKNRIYRPGLIRMVLSDPSEAVQSSMILPSIHRYFTILDEKPLGGNLLHLVLKDIAHHFIDPDARARDVLEGMIQTEDRFIADKQSDFVFGVYCRR